MALQVTCGPGPVRQEGSELPRCVTARMCAPVVPATVAYGHFEIVTKPTKRDMQGERAMVRQAHHEREIPTSRDSPRACRRVPFLSMIYDSGHYTKNIIGGNLL